MKASKLLIGLGLLVIAASTAAAQGDTHTIVRRDHYSNLPYEIVSWMVDGKPVSDVSRFTAGPDWWQHIAISAKNVTQKTITHGSFDLFVDPMGKMTTRVAMKIQPSRPAERPSYGSVRSTSPMVAGGSLANIRNPARTTPGHWITDSTTTRPR